MRSRPYCAPSQRGVSCFICLVRRQQHSTTMEMRIAVGMGSKRTRQRLPSSKAAEFFKKVAIQGHTHGRYNLGCYKWDKGNSNCAVRHFLLISAKMGHLK